METTFYRYDGQFRCFKEPTNKKMNFWMLIGAVHEDAVIHLDATFVMILIE